MKKNLRMLLVARIYLWLARVIPRIYIYVTTLFVGFWLGVLKRETLQYIDYLHFEKTAKYRSEEHNQQGLWGWEERALDRHFKDCKNILVGGAGGGREVLALRRRGLEADGFECHPALVEYANELLAKEGFAATVQLAPRDGCPEISRKYDGIIIGWGVYMLIQGQERRIAFLRQLRSLAREQAPLLLSFFERTDDDRRYKEIAAIGNFLRTCLLRDRLTVGDYLVPFYAHCFTEGQVAYELREGGFELAFYSTDEYAHAVGVAS